jgi:glycerol kinase
LKQLRVDGGAAVNNLLMQFQADLLGVPVIRPKITETTALGAAYLAGLAVGFWGDLDAISGQWEIERKFEPTMSENKAKLLYSGWLNAVEKAKEKTDYD